jgi:dTDP-4-amino-4,6-dideoxygalactose transaminase
MSDTVMGPLQATLYSGYIGEGNKVAEFEKVVSEKLQCPHVLGLNCGTSGLHLAYQMITDYNPHAEIIASPMTCSATLTPIVAVGAKIVWADIDPVSGNIDPVDVERKITANTRAIIAVHWGGNPCDIVRLNEIGAKHHIKVVEDAAHAMGAKLNGRYIGSFSDFTIFSLQAIKHVTSVDGGLLICRDEESHKRAKLLRWYGIDRTENEVTDLRCESDIVEAGHKMHMNDVCATIGMENFKHLDEIITRHQANAEYYNRMFERTQIGVTSHLSGAESAYWLFTIHVGNRDELMTELRNNGVMASKVHTRNDTHSMFKRFKGDLPCVEEFDNSHLCIPVGWWVTKENREKIARLVLKYAKEKV